MTAPDAMPERVMLVPAGPEKASGSYYLATGTGTGAALYVPESRLLAAEARVREVEAEMLDTAQQAMRLRAERDALVPLARFAMRVHDTGDNTADAAVADGVLVWVRDSECDESPAFTQARSILAREET